MKTNSNTKLVYIEKFDTKSKVNNKFNNFLFRN